MKILSKIFGVFTALLGLTWAADMLQSGISMTIIAPAAIFIFGILIIFIKYEDSFEEDKNLPGIFEKWDESEREEFENHE